MTDFKIVRVIYQTLYVLIWCFASLLIVAALVDVFTDTFDKLVDFPIQTVAIFIAVVVLTALILSWLLVITICSIDSRNFLAEIHAMKVKEMSGQRGVRNFDGFRDSLE